MRTSLRGKVRHAGGGVALMPVGGTLDSMAPTWELNEDLCNSRIPHKGRLHSSRGFGFLHLSLPLSLPLSPSPSRLSVFTINPQHECGSQFFPSSICDSGIELKSPGLVTSTLPT